MHKRTVGGPAHMTKRISTRIVGVSFFLFGLPIGISDYVSISLAMPVWGKLLAVAPLVIVRTLVASIGLYLYFIWERRRVRERAGRTRE